MAFLATALQFATGRWIWLVGGAVALALLSGFCFVKGVNYQQGREAIAHAKELQASLNALQASADARRALDVAAAKRATEEAEKRMADEKVRRLQAEKSASALRGHIASLPVFEACHSGSELADLINGESK